MNTLSNISKSKYMFFINHINILTFFETTSEVTIKQPIIQKSALKSGGSSKLKKNVISRANTGINAPIW